MYIQKTCIDESFVGNGILFLMNCKKLDHNSKEKIKDIYPKNGKIIVFDQNNYIGCSFDPTEITFETSFGSKILLKVHKCITIETLIKKYLKEIETEENGKEKELIFLFNGTKLNPNSEEKVDEKFRSKNVLITVFDQNHIIKD